MLAHLADEFRDGVPVSGASSMIELVQVVSTLCRVGLSMGREELSVFIPSGGLRGKRESAGKTHSHGARALRWQPAREK